jgi:uncharacterized protein
MRGDFDLGGVDTYYTRPMPEASTKTISVEPLADDEAELRVSIPLADFPRVQARLGTTEGMIDGRIKFRRDGGFAVAAVEVSGSVPLVCQRCLGLMSWPIDGAAQVALIPAESQADEVPEHLEPVWAPGGQISLRDLVEEELLLGLPIVPLHEDTSVCVPTAVPVASDEPSVDRNSVQRPFEQLSELLKRNSDSSIAPEEIDRGRSKKS